MFAMQRQQDIRVEIHKYGRYGLTFPANRTLIEFEFLRRR